MSRKNSYNYIKIPGKSKIPGKYQPNILPTVNTFSTQYNSEDAVIS